MTSPFSRRVLLRNGVIDGAGTQATAMLTDGATIAWIGAEDDLPQARVGADEVIDLGGDLVTPGFVDAHAHLAQTGLSARGVDLGGARSRTEALAAIDAHASAGTERVLIGSGWDDTEWPDGRFTREELDRATGGRVAYLARVDAHSAIVSSRLVDHAPHMPSAEGWRADGWVTGEAHHLARNAIDAMITPGERRTAIERALDAAARAGIVSVHELGAPHLSLVEDFTLIDELAAARPLPEVVKYWGELDAYELAAECGVRGLAGDLCCDGAIGSGTAALLHPYDDNPGMDGVLHLERGQIREHVAACTRRGLQAGFHVIGDRAVETVLGGFEDAVADVGADAIRGARHRLEHVELLSAEAVERLARLRLVVSAQPAFDAEWGGGDGLYRHRLGDARMRRMNPLGELSAAGVPLAFGSDTPVTPFAPWAGVRAAVGHHQPGQRMSPRAAFVAHTAGGRYAAGEPATTAALTVGSAATYAVWSGAVSVEALSEAEPECRLTVRDGSVLYAG